MKTEVDLIKEGKIINTVEVNIIKDNENEGCTESGGIVKKVNGRWVYYV